MRTTNLSHALASIEFFIGWCFWMVVVFFAGSLTGWKGGFYVWRSFERQKYFANMPYEKILDFAKRKYEIAKMPIPYSQEEITFYAFIMNPKIQQGLHSVVAAIFLSITIAIGVDWVILYIFIAMLFVFGIIKIMQGSMDIL